MEMEYGKGIPKKDGYYWFKAKKHYNPIIVELKYYGESPEDYEPNIYQAGVLPPIVIHDNGDNLFKGPLTDGKAKP